MGAYFLDSSAIAKLYVAERGTVRVTELLNPAARNDIFIVRIAAVEVAAALFRRVRANLLLRAEAKRALSAIRYDLRSMYHVVELSPALADLALNAAEQHGLRGYGCVQLAAARSIHRQRVAARLDPLTLVSADLDLNAAAMAEGLKVENPDQYP